MIAKQFNIANYAGKKAFEELSICSKIHSLSIKEVLIENNIPIPSFNNDLEFDRLIKDNSIQTLKLSKVEDLNAFQLSRVLLKISNKEIEHLINVVIFIQVMLESDINNVSYNPNLTFNDKWKNFLNENKASEEEKQSFYSYHKNIYQELRIPVIHPSEKIGVRNISKFNFKYIHTNIKEGWFSFCFLLNKANKIELDYEINWRNMCALYDIPSCINGLKFKDIEQFAISLNEKYLKKLNDKN